MLCYEHAQVVKNDIVRSGLVPNKDKSIWKPIQTIEWLRFLWDLKLCILRVPEKKVFEITALISALLSNSHRVRVVYWDGQSRICGVCDGVLLELA